MTGFTIELMACEMVLLQEIGEPKCKQKDIAMTYAMAICSSDKPDWSKVNNAIIARWSKSGLARIKKAAWKLIEAKRSTP